MRRKGAGRVVVVTSEWGVIGWPNATAYSASKAGLIGMTRSLAKELGSRNITVNTVAPGFIDTDMTRELSDEHKNALLGSIALGRLGQAAEIAHAVSFLASEGAAYITGETLHVNGGMFMA
jgi:3-oxoacyl-[acyl-carrier protein] reductase